MEEDVIQDQRTIHSWTRREQQRTETNQPPTKPASWLTGYSDNWSQMIVVEILLLCLHDVAVQTVCTGTEREKKMK